MKRPCPHSPEEFESTLLRAKIKNHLLESERIYLHNRIVSLQDAIKDKKRQWKKQKMESEKLRNNISQVAVSLDQENDPKKMKVAIQSILTEFGWEKKKTNSIDETKQNSNSNSNSREQKIVLIQSETDREDRGGSSHMPIHILKANVQLQYTLTKKQALGLSLEEKRKLVPAFVRIMGSGKSLKEIYVVAKDLCLLIDIRKGNVAKAVCQINSNEKFHMGVLCSRTNGVTLTQKLTVLTIFGVLRLLRNSVSNNGREIWVFFIFFLLFFSFVCEKMDL